jgi:hypothetical protein
MAENRLTGDGDPNVLRARFEVRLSAPKIQQLEGADRTPDWQEAMSMRNLAGAVVVNAHAELELPYRPRRE